MEVSDAVVERLEQLAPGARRVLLGVSGGGDSVAALRWLLEGGVDVVAAHFDHRLRPGSDDDARFVATLCATLGVPCEHGSADVAAVARARGWNLEAGARTLRYAFLHAAARRVGADVVAVAHTRDDQAETVMLQLLRGAAYARGMPPRRGALVRPLLDTPRAATRAYLQAVGQTYLDDPSNRDLRRRRAWLRHEVFPMLERAEPDASARLAALATDQRAAEDALRAWARRRFGEGPLPVAGLRAAPAGLRRMALRELLARAGADVTRRRLAALEAALERTAPWRMQLGPDAWVRVAYGSVAIVGPAPLPPPERAVRSVEDLPAGIDPGVLERTGPWVLRSRRPGDRIHLPAGHVRVSDLLIDRKVPREERDALRMLASGPDVVWIEGVAASPGVSTAPLDPDEEGMGHALHAARDAAARGETPVGAAVVVDGRVVATAGNETERSEDPGAHAEMLALRRAGAATRDWRLEGGTLYVTLEPCPMCFGAVLQTRLARVVYGAPNPREGALGGAIDLRDGAWKRQPSVRGGVRATEAAALLRGVFAAKRRS